MANEAKVIEALKEIARERIRFLEYLNANEELRSPNIFKAANFPHFETGLPPVESSDVYSAWEKQSDRKKGKKDEIEHYVDQIKRLDRTISEKVSEQIFSEMSRVTEKLSDLESGRYSLEEARALQSTPIYYVQGTVNKEQLNQLASLDYDISQKIIELETEQLEKLISESEEFSNDLYRLDYTRETIPERPVIDWRLFEEVREKEAREREKVSVSEGRIKNNLADMDSRRVKLSLDLLGMEGEGDNVSKKKAELKKLDGEIEALRGTLRQPGPGERLEGLGIAIELKLAELHELKRRRDIGLKQEGERFLQKYKEYEAFSKKLEETNPFDVESVLSEKPHLALEDSAFYDPAAEQAQKIKRKLEKYDQKINRKVAQLRKDAAALRKNAVFSELQEHSFQLVSYSKLLEKGTDRLSDRPKKLNTNELREAFGRRLEEKKKNFMKQHEGATEQDWEMFKRSNQDILEKEIRKLERLEEALDSHMNELVVNGTLVEFEDGTTQTVDWVRNEQLRVESEQLERIDVLKRFNETHRDFFLGLVSPMSSLEVQEEYFKKRPQTPSFELDATKEIEALKNVKTPSSETQSKIKRLEKVLELQSEIDIRNREIDVLMEATRKRDKLKEFSDGLSREIDQLSDFFRSSNNLEALTELDTLREELGARQNDYFNSLEHSSDDANDLKVFKEACQNAVRSCISTIEENANKRLPTKQAEEVQEQTSSFWKLIVRLLEHFFPSKQVRPADTEESEVELVEKAVPTSEQFKKKFEEKISHERDAHEDEENKENRSENQQGGEEDNLNTTLDM